MGVNDSANSIARQRARKGIGAGVFSEPGKLPDGGFGHERLTIPFEPEVKRIPFEALLPEPLTDAELASVLKGRTGQEQLFELARLKILKLTPVEVLPKTKKPSPKGGKPKPTAKLNVATTDTQASQPEAALTLGGLDDRVTLELGGTEVLVAESYDVHVAVFTQPANFGLTLGHAGIVKELLLLCAPHTPFVLRVGGIVVQTGFVDGYSVGGAHATVQVHGRDTLQDVHDSYCGVERSFNEKTHLEFVRAVLEHSKLTTEVPTLTNDAMRRAMARGKPLPPDKPLEEKKVKGPVRMRLGDRYFDFIKRVLDRAGLFMYVAPNGKLLITSPDATSAPLYRLVHAPKDRSIGNVEDYNFSYSTADRVGEYVVYGRGGHKHVGTLKHKGQFYDKEMIAMGYAHRIHTFRDWHITSDDQAVLLARRMIAEHRRKAWSLTVTVAGHTTQELGSTNRIVWRPDTMVLFRSDQLKIEDTLYIEDVRYVRSRQGTFTHLRLMRREDLVFGYETLE